jgi:hypothetical protein
MGNNNRTRVEQLGGFEPDQPFVSSCRRDPAIEVRSSDVTAPIAHLPYTSLVGLLALRYFAYIPSRPYLERPAALVNIFSYISI